MQNTTKAAPKTSGRRKTISIKAPTISKSKSQSQQKNPPATLLPTEDKTKEEICESSEGLFRNKVCVCPTGKINVDGKCLIKSCQSHQYFKDGKCTTCPTNAVCSGSDEYSCSPGFAKSTTGCSIISCSAGGQLNKEKTGCTCTSNSYGTYPDCTACPKNTTANTSIGKCECSSNTYGKSPDCKTCPNGGICDGTENFSCQPGYLKDEKTKTCTRILCNEKGGVLNSSKDGCVCSSNRYGTYPNCTTCPPNATCNGENFTCKQGYLRNGTNCQCAANYEGKGSTENGCTACPQNFEKLAGDGKCTDMKPKISCEEDGGKWGECVCSADTENCPTSKTACIGSNNKWYDYCDMSEKTSCEENGGKWGSCACPAGTKNCPTTRTACLNSNNMWSYYCVMPKKEVSQP